MDPTGVVVVPGEMIEEILRRLTAAAAKESAYVAAVARGELTNDWVDATLDEAAWSYRSTAPSSGRREPPSTAVRSLTFSPVTSIIGGLWRAGSPGRELAMALDIIRSTSLSYAWRRATNQIRAARTDRLEGDPAYRAIWTEAAQELDAEIVELPSGFLEIRANGAWTRVFRQCVMLDDPVTLRFALDKPLVQHRLSSDGVPVLQYLEFDARDRSRRPSSSRMVPPPAS